MNSTWRRAKLNEVLRPIERPERPVSGRTYRQLGVRLWGAGAYERESIEGGATRYKSLSRVETDDVVVNKIWARNGSVAVVQPSLAGCYVSSEFPTYAPLLDRIDPRWMHWLTKTAEFWNLCDEKSQGTSGKNRIRPEQFLNIEVSLPSLDEQRRIVERLDALTSMVDGLKRELECQMSSELACSQSLIDYGIAGGLSEHWRREHMGTLAGSPAIGGPMSNSDTSVGIRIPGSWRWVRLKAVAAVLDVDHRMPENSENGIPLVSPKDFIGDDQIDFVGTKRISEDDYLRMSKKCKPQPGDVLFSRYGTIGNVRRVPSGMKFQISYSLCIVRPLPRCLSTDYLYWLLKSSLVLDQALKAKRHIAVPDLGLRYIREFDLPIPPMSEQEAIAERLATAYSKAMCIQNETLATIDGAKRLRSSILTAAFQGDLAE